MARLLVATVPLTGHVHPMLVLVRALVTRGHEVRWYAAAKFAPAIAAAGATYLPMRAHDWDDADVEAALPALRGRRGLARVKAQLREMFIAPMADQLRDLQAIAAGWMPDAIVADQAHLGAAAFAELAGVPWAGLGISALVIPSVDTAPFGPGWRPARGVLGRLRARLQHAVVRAMFRDVTRAYRAARQAIGLPAGRGTYFDVLSPQLFLQPTVEAFEYPRRDLPPQVRFIGPLVAGVPAAQALPAWWSELEDAHRRGTPIVLVTQGTLATDARELVAPALRALATEPVFVVATIATTIDGPVPANARVAAFVPYQALLPMVAVLVTNGGYGGVQMALAAGVPVVVAGGSEEKPEIAARVAWSGVGVDLRTGRPSAGRVRAAVRRVLADARYRTRARAMAAAMAACDAPTLGATHVEDLVERARLAGSR
ncbi:MAG: glycosyltransferase [Proteobacteria bacterium]|nr:glycosyltransferase [Pseudomonadota bacterium]